MKIAIDAYNIALEHGTGVATYGRNLARAAAGLGHTVGVLFGSSAPFAKISLLNEVALAEGDSSTRRRKPWSSWPRTVVEAGVGAVHGRLAKQINISGRVILPAGLRLDAARYWNVPNLYTAATGAFYVGNGFTTVKGLDVEVAHWTYPMPVRAAHARNVYTLHDLVPLRLPYTTADQKRYYYRLCARIARQADHIVTVSECSRRDIIEILGVDADRVTNLYQASSLSENLETADEAEVARYVEGLLGVGMREYFIFFGAIEPKKNIARLLEAYLGSGAAASLVIVGAPGWGSDKEVKLLKSMVALDNRKRIIWLGYLPREMLAMLIAGARATLFPSIYEGFGLPVLESMALGTPVITSNTSSLPEVAGDAAILVDPYNVRSIMDGIMTVDRDETLRTALADRGLLQAAKFSAGVYQERLRTFYSSLA